MVSSRRRNSSETRTGGWSKASARILIHDFLWALRRLLLLIALGFAVFFVLMPLSTAAVSHTSIFNLSYTHDQLKFRLFAEQLPVVIEFAVAVYGLGIGLVLFRFGLSRQQTAFYFSLGVSRRSMFVSRYAAGFFAILAAVLVPLGISVLLNCVALGVSPGLLVHSAYVAFGLLAVGLLAFTVTSAACVLAGTIAEAVVYTVSILGAVSIVAWGANALMNKLLVGSAYGRLTYAGTVSVGTSLLEYSAVCNPLLFFSQSLKTASVFSRTGLQSEPSGVSWLLPAGWFLFALCLAAVTLLGFERRRNEKAGMAGLSTAMTIFVTLALGFGAFAVVFHFASPLGSVVAVVAALAVLLLVTLVTPVAMGGRKVGRVRSLSLVVVEAGAVFALVVVLWTGGAGYSTRVPDLKGVSSVSISYVGSPSYLGTDIAAASVGKAYYFSATYAYTDLSALKLVASVQRRLGEHGSASLSAKSDDFSQTVVPYDIVITYKKAGGGELTRYYDRATLSDLSSLLKLDETEEVKGTEKAVVAGPGGSQATDYSGEGLGQSPAATAYASGSIYLSDAWYSKPVLLQLSTQKRNELLKALSEDVVSQSSSDRYFPSTPTLGVLMFSVDGERDLETFSYGIENTIVYLTGKMTRTLAFLRNNNLLSVLQFQGQIESLSFQKYDPYSGINRVKQPSSPYFLAYRSTSPDDFWTQEDFGLHMTITDPQKIAQVAGNLQSAYFMSDGGYLVAAKLKGSNYYVYRYLPATKAPDYVRKAVL